MYLKKLYHKKRKIGSDDSMNQFIYKALNDKELNDGEFRLYSLIKELGKQAVIIDSLKKVTKTEKENYRIQSEALKNKSDSIKILKLTL